MESKIEAEAFREEEISSHLFDLAMKRKWKEIKKLYKKYPTARSAKITKSEETALHVAISGYRSNHVSAHYEQYTVEMINSILEEEKEEDALKILSMKNDKGNTPLHLAAAVGRHSIYESIASKHRQLISIRNSKGETPLFVAAYHGKLKAFLYLHGLYSQKPVPQQKEEESLCRREDGNTVLHVAISGEHLELAYEIIRNYPKMVNSVNEDGELPLHILARKPSLFKSGTHLGFFDILIYQCIMVDKLKGHEFKKSVYRPSSDIKCPENYQTCIDIFFLFFAPINESIKAGLQRCRIGHSKQQPSSHDEENPPEREKKLQHEDKEEDEDDEYKGHVFPRNYATCVCFLKFSMKVALTVMGVGFWRIWRIQQKKERHKHALEIMEKMITGSVYEYENNGEKPEEPGMQDPGRVPPPSIPPSTEDQHVVDDWNSTETNGGRSWPREDENRSMKMENRVFRVRQTPILVAAKMGILEMVEKIIDKIPVAIQDLDSSGKNVLMLAAENKQDAVFNHLVKMKPPESLFDQLDDQGNSILHLAAQLGELPPWRIQGDVLQMQCEIKWYKHVKHSVPPQSFAHNNKKGETPRKIFKQTHKTLVREAADWLNKTSNSCSVIAALIATVAFATSATVPGGLREKDGRPVLEKRTAFDVFSTISLVALTLAVTALVIFLSIITSRSQERDFKSKLPRRLLLGLTSLFASIVAILISFCAGHTFILRQEMRYAAVPLYVVASIPVTFFLLVQLQLYFDLLWAAFRKVPVRSYKVF